MTEDTSQPAIQEVGDSEAPAFAGYPDGCPICDAVPANGPAFRVTLNDPPLVDDFKSHHELGIEPKPKSTANQRCRFRSISVYMTIDDARHHIKKYAHRFGNGRIAAGRLTQRMGKTLLTPSPDRPTHTEWWKADGVDSLAFFKVIE